MIDVFSSDTRLRHGFTLLHCFACSQGNPYYNLDQSPYVAKIIDYLRNALGACLPRPGRLLSLEWLQVLLESFLLHIKQHVTLTAAFRLFDLGCLCC